ncbi:MAG: universal stress protein [Terriglobales bacterium]
MFKKIAVATDGSPTADKAVDVAIDLAERYQGALLIFSAYAPVSAARIEREQQEAPDEVQWMINPSEDVNQVLALAEERATARGLKTMAIAGQGEPASVICGLAAEHQADLLVIGNKGMKRRVFGSVPKTISQNAPCSVVIAKTT